MGYLLDNDPSLTESLEIAEEYGYSPSELNSELLASLLKTRRNQENFPTNDIQDILDGLDWETYLEDSNGQRWELTDENIAFICNEEYGKDMWKVEEDKIYWKANKDEWVESEVIIISRQ